MERVLERERRLPCVSPDGALLAPSEAFGMPATFLRFIREASIVRLLGAASFVWFVILGARLPVDTDEGFYALAVELVTHGRVPYRDFFYPQGPLYPYLFAPFSFVFGAGFMTLRVISSAFAAAAATLVAHAVHRETKSTLGTTAAVILFVTHELSWQWLVTIRPYGLAEVFLLGSLILATPPGREPRPLELALSGALGMAAPLMRLPLAPAFGVVPLALLLRGTNASLYRGALIFGLVVAGGSTGRHPLASAIAGTLAAFAVAVAGRGCVASLKRVGWYVLGAASVAIPIVAFFGRHWGAFAYGLVGYHTDSSSLVNFPEYRVYLSAIVGGGSWVELSATGMQTALLLVANVVALTLPGAPIRMASLSGVAVLVLGSVRHSPMHEHYLTFIVPYLAIGAGVALGPFDRRDTAESRTHLVRPATALVIAASAVFLLATSSSIEKKWIRGRYYGWDCSAFRPSTTDRTLAAVTRAVRAYPGPLLTTWAGSALRNGEHVMPGYENHFTRLVAGQKTPAEAAVLHLTSENDLRTAIQKRTPRIVVLDRGAGASRSAMDTLVPAAGYTPLEILGDVAIYLRK
jgi:hypothetical protein